MNLFDDSYNSAPDSVKASLKSLKIYGKNQGHRMIVVLGTMSELGEFAIEAHKAIGVAVADIKPEILITVGKLAIQIGLTAQIAETYHFNDSIEAGEKIVSLIQPGDYILVKGSRVMGMESIVKAIEEGFSLD